jgi:anthranilate synthase component I
MTASFLLESVEGGERLGRYSFVGSAPSTVIRVGDGCPHTGDPLPVLQSMLDKTRLIVPPGIKLPEFTGGAVGYVSYDCVRFFEPRTAPGIAAQSDAMAIPDAVFMLADTIVIFDHVRRTIKIVAHCAVAGDQAADSGIVADAYAAACGAIDGVLQRLSAPLETRHRPAAAMLSPERGGGVDAVRAAPTASDGFDCESNSNMGRAGYEGCVRSLQEHIVDGDIIQAVPSHRVVRQLPGNVTAFDVYRQLRVINPSPYMFFLDLAQDFQVGGARWIL